MAFALGTQGLLVVIAVVAAVARGRGFAWGEPADVGAGLVVALALAAINWWLLRRAPANPVVTGVRKVYDDLLAPLFRGLTPAGAVVVGLAAGIGEELLFRGVLQEAVGLAGASVLFGLAHATGRGSGPFVVWATLMGGVLGWLYAATGGLLAPMAAHGIYDVLALTYIRRTSGAGDTAEDRE